MNAEIFLADLKKSFAAVNAKFRTSKEKVVQIVKQNKTAKNDEAEYTGPDWLPEAKIHQLKKQLEAEELQAALNSLSYNEVAQLVKAVTKAPSLKEDYWYKQPSGIFI